MWGVGVGVGEGEGEGVTVRVKVRVRVFTLLSPSPSPFLTSTIDILWKICPKVMFLEKTCQSRKFCPALSCRAARAGL